MDLAESEITGLEEVAGRIRIQVRFNGEVCCRIVKESSCESKIGGYAVHVMKAGEYGRLRWSWRAGSGGV